MAKRIVSIPHKFRLAGAISFRKDYSPPPLVRHLDPTEVQSPHKKCCEVGEMLGKISDSIAARSSSRDRARNREQEEVDAAMRLLEDDGVPIPSDLYFTALKSFESSVLRREFLNMSDPEVRIPWLTWLKNQNQNQK